MMRVRRREFLVAAGALATAPLARAQMPGEGRTIGLLSPHTPLPPEHPFARAVAATFERHGWKLGETLRMERPNADGREDSLPAMAEELVRKRVEVIWAIGPEAAVAAARATRAIPIVFWGVAYPIEQGLVDSYARPGRNATGIAFVTAPELRGKVLEYLRQIAPAARRLATIGTPSARATVKGGYVPGATPVMRAAAKNLGFEYREHEIARVEDFGAVFAGILTSRADALFVQGSTLTNRERVRFVEFANRNRLPSAFDQREFVEAGGLFSYGIDSVDTGVQTVTYIDKILRGARPADLPVELPSRYELAINRGTERALGLRIPKSVLLRADRVIE